MAFYFSSVPIFVSFHALTAAALAAKKLMSPCRIR
jgi:hypothetical protein